MENGRSIIFLPTGSGKGVESLLEHDFTPNCCIWLVLCTTTTMEDRQTEASGFKVPLLFGGCRKERGGDWVWMDNVLDTDRYPMKYPTLLCTNYCLIFVTVVRGPRYAVSETLHNKRGIYWTTNNNKMEVVIIAMPTIQHWRQQDNTVPLLIPFQ